MARKIDLWEKYSPWHDWWEDSFDTFKELGEAFGFDITDIDFSGFSSQGDGACFEGTLTYRKGWKASLAALTSDSKVVAIAQRWQELQSRCFYQLRATVKHSGRYSHEYCTTIDCEDSRDSYRELPEGVADTASDIARDYMRWIYRQLETESEYQQASNFAFGWLELSESMKETRRDARQLVSDMRASMKAGLNATPTICAALRSQLRGLIDQWEAMRAEREQLGSEFWYRDKETGKTLSIAEFAQKYA